jgi:hypothetical protein
MKTAKLRKSASGRLWVLYDDNRNDPLYTCRVADFPMATAAREHMEAELHRIAASEKYSMPWLDDAMRGVTP